MQKFSQILSGLFSPLLIPTYGMILVSFLTVLSFLSLDLRLVAIGITFVVTCLIPISAIGALYRTGVIKDKRLRERRERMIPYLIAILCYAGCGYFFIKANAPMWIPLFFFGASLSVFVTVIVNNWWKISAHSTAVGGLVALMFKITVSHYAMCDMNVWISSIVILAGLVMTLRIYLGCHTLWQTLAGFANGFLCVYMISMLY